MEITPVDIQFYETASERRPFQEWLDSLDTRAQQIVTARLARVRRGLFGDVKPIGHIFELKIDFGPEHRLYFGKDGRFLVILICGGDKKRQSADIAAAQAYWSDYLWRKR